MKTYCTQNKGDCLACSLVNYGRDCANNPVAQHVTDGYCRDCNRPVIYCDHYFNYDASAKAKYNNCADNDTNRPTQQEIDRFFN